jgi:hypothetical protein
MCGNGTKGLGVDCLGTRQDQRGFPSRGWDAVLDCTGVEQVRYPRFGRLLAPKGAEAVGASELEQGVCDTVRTDRDDGYLCW